MFDILRYEAFFKNSFCILIPPIQLVEQLNWPFGAAPVWPSNYYGFDESILHHMNYDRIVTFTFACKPVKSKVLCNKGNFSNLVSFRVQNWTTFETQ